MQTFNKQLEKINNSLKDNELFIKHKEICTKCNNLITNVVSKYFSDVNNTIIDDTTTNEVIKVRNRINENLEMIYKEFDDKYLLVLLENTIRILMYFLLAFTNDSSHKSLLLNEDNKDDELIKQLLDSDYGLYEVIDFNDYIITIKNIFTNVVFDVYDPMFKVFLDQIDIRRNHYVFTRVINYEQISFISFSIIVKMDDEVILECIEYFKDNQLDNVKLIDFINRAIPYCIM